MSESGGGIYAQWSILDMQTGYFRSNTASRHGGIHAVDSEVAIMGQDMVITGNRPINLYDIMVSAPWRFFVWLITPSVWRFSAVVVITLFGILYCRKKITKTV
jgi:hypothetical protein